tara:strand:- start:20 stop:298 length:279 start_codon:yes stop_codon:yes gene_type:complete
MIKDKLLENILLKVLFATFIWILYLEINPKIRGVWLRPNAENKIIFCPKNILNLVFFCFKNVNIWKLQFWDINYFYFTIIIVSLITLIRAKL